MAVPRTVATLSRWSALAGDQPLPSEWSDLPLHQQIAIRDADPQLAAVMSGQPLPPALELAVANGSWPDVMPAGPSEEEQRQQQIAQLLSQGNPYMPGPAGNLTTALRLEQVAPEIARQQQQLAAPYVRQAAEQAQQERAQRAQLAQSQSQQVSQAMAQQAARQTIARRRFP
jgi:hypothetical protein